jgi:hypothetical protein
MGRHLGPPPRGAAKLLPNFEYFESVPKPHRVAMTMTGCHPATRTLPLRTVTLKMVLETSLQGLMHSIETYIRVREGYILEWVRRF